MRIFPLFVASSHSKPVKAEKYIYTSTRLHWWQARALTPKLDRAISVILLWVRSKMLGENSPAWPGDHKTAEIPASEKKSNTNSTVSLLPLLPYSVFRCLCSNGVTVDVNRENEIQQFWISVLLFCCWRCWQLIYYLIFTFQFHFVILHLCVVVVSIAL